jgi:hypothetical protein
MDSNIDQKVLTDCITRMSYEEDIAPEDLLANVPSFTMIKCTPIDGPITRGQQDFLKESLRILHSIEWTHQDLHIKNLMIGPD